jgi:hypothetical protein
VATHTFWCETHDKGCYFGRRSAKRMIRVMHEKGMREYECDAIPGGWHIGHMPAAVRSGETTRAEMYAPDGTRIVH